MTAQTWHLDHELAELYTSGQAGGDVSASIEQHLIGCGQCRGLLVPYAEPEHSDRIWAGVIERVQAPPTGRLERLLRACGMPDSMARLLSVTPSLRGSWLTAVVFVLVLAELAGNSSTGGIVLFMALAPVLPMISVAAAFGGDMDPSRGMVAAAPYPMLRLLLVRTTAVVACTLLPAAALALLLPGPSWLAMGCLLPSLALTSIVLVLTPRVPALPVSGTLAAAWMVLVAWGWTRDHDPFLAASFAVQLTSVGVLLTSLALLVIRQASLDEQIRRAS